MVENRINSPEYKKALAMLFAVEDKIRLKYYDSAKPGDEAKIDALNFAKHSLVYAKLLPPTDEDFSKIEVARWRAALLPISENNWTILKQEIIKVGQTFKSSEEELPEASTGFFNLANSLP